MTLAAITFAMGYFGLQEAYRVAGLPISTFTLIYTTMQLFVLESSIFISNPGLELQVARIIAPLLTISTLIFFLATHFRDNIRLLCLRVARGHTVVCGLGQLGSVISDLLIEAGHRVVVIEKDSTNPYCHEINARGGMVINGDATSLSVLQDAQIKNARYLFCVLGEDSMNAGTAAVARTLIEKDEKAPLTCFIHVVDPELPLVLRQHELESGRDGKMRIEIFNIFRSAGMGIVRVDSPFLMIGSEKIPRIVVVGGGRVGEALIAAAARMWRNARNNAGEKLRVTLVDREAGKRADLIRIRHPSISASCEILPITMDTHSAEFFSTPFLYEDGGPADAVYICIGDGNGGLAAALRIRARLKETAIPVVVTTMTDVGMAFLLREENADELPSIAIFPLISRSRGLDSIIEATPEIIARAIHERYLVMNSEGPVRRPWDELSEEMRESNRRQADAILDRLEMIGARVDYMPEEDPGIFSFTAEEIELLAEAEHKRWMKEKKANGWDYGLERNDKKKIHPSLIPYEKLSEEEKEKDREVIKQIPLLLLSVDMAITRENLPNPSEETRYPMNNTR